MSVSYRVDGVCTIVEVKAIRINCPFGDWDTLSIVNIQLQTYQSTGKFNYCGWGLSHRIEIYEINCLPAGAILYQCGDHCQDLISSQRSLSWSFNSNIPPLQPPSKQLFELRLLLKSQSRRPQILPAFQLSGTVKETLVIERVFYLWSNRYLYLIWLPTYGHNLP